MRTRIVMLTILVGLLAHEFACAKLPTNSTIDWPPGAYDVADVNVDSLGTFVIRFFPQDAPKTVAQFEQLADSGFYDSTTFHRVIAGFIIQGGDPLSKDSIRADDGTGAPAGADSVIPAEISRPNLRGSVGMARKPDSINPTKESNGSQFYICLEPQPLLDGEYTVFGQVVKGMYYVDLISTVAVDSLDNPITPVRIKNITIRHIPAGGSP